MNRALRRGAAAALLLTGLTACVEREHIKPGTFRMQVSLAKPDGSDLPGPDTLACVDLRGTSKTCTDGGTYLLGITAVAEDGNVDTTFNGDVRVDVVPGSIAALAGDAVQGRNVHLTNGVAQGQQITLTGAYGDVHVLAEDIGYLPVDPNVRAPGCSDGLDNDGDGLIDFPADPGCAYANDDTEIGGTYAAGASSTLYYDLPTIPEVQGLGPSTPFQAQDVQAKVLGDGINVIVNRVSAQGFYVTDSNVATDANGVPVVARKDYGSLYVFNFGVPNGVRVCDKVTFLSGSMSEFHGYTEMGNPSFEVHPWAFPTLDANGNEVAHNDGPCLLPPPTVLDVSVVANAAELEKDEAGLVRLYGAHVAKHLGSGLPTRTVAGSANQCGISYQFTFSATATNCDTNGDGNVNFDDSCGEELACANQCYDDPECSEWTQFSGLGSYRLVLPPAGTSPDTPQTDPSQTILAKTSTVGEFRPQRYAGRILPAITGTLSNFSGGKLNWTIEARCPDDVVICPDGDTACEGTTPTSDQLDLVNGHLPCVEPRTQAENDAQD